MNGSLVFLAHFDAFSGLNLICDCRTDLGSRSLVFLAHFDAFSGLNLICDCRTDLGSRISVISVLSTF